jgi:hypothetical protein
MRAVTWVKTTEKPTVKTRLMPLRESYPLERYFLWAFTETFLRQLAPGTPHRSADLPEPTDPLAELRSGL